MSTIEIKIPQEGSCVPVIRIEAIDANGFKVDDCPRCECSEPICIDILGDRPRSRFLCADCGRTWRTVAEA